MEYADKKKSKYAQNRVIYPGKKKKVKRKSAFKRRKRKKLQKEI